MKRNFNQDLRIRITFRLTRNLAAKIHHEGVKLGRKDSNIIRQCVINELCSSGNNMTGRYRNQVIKSNAAVVKSINDLTLNIYEIGSNINQIAYHLNTNNHLIAGDRTLLNIIIKSLEKVKRNYPTMFNKNQMLERKSKNGN